MDNLLAGIVGALAALLIGGIGGGWKLGRVLGNLDGTMAEVRTTLKRHEDDLDYLMRQAVDTRRRAMGGD